MFRLTNILIAFRCCHLQVQNLDWIITIINNWPDDLHLNCTSNVNLKDYLKVEIGLIEDSYGLIKEVEF
jgi:hypothetical protein